MEKRGLPRIMYDQTQFTPICWIDPKGTYLNEEIYKRMKEISGYAPVRWITYTQNLPESFWFGAYDEDALEKEAEIGLQNFSNKEFLKRFDEAMQESYQKTFDLKSIYFKDFYGKEQVILDKNPEKAAHFLEKVREVNTFMLSYYFLTQPQRFYKFDTELQNEGANQDTEFIAAHGRSLTYVSLLTKEILDYIDLLITENISLEEGKNRYPHEYEKLVETVQNIGFLNWGVLGGDLIDENNIDIELGKLIEDKNKFSEEKKKMQELISSVEKRNDLLVHNSTRAYMLADIMGHSSVLRFNLQTCILCILKYTDNLLKVLATKYAIPEGEMNAYELEEALQLIRAGKKADADMLIARQKGYLRIYFENEIKTFLAEDAHKEIADLLEFRKNEILSTKDVKGTIASWPDKSTEIIRGKAFVLTTAFGADNVVKDMKAGEILIATQTHPNLVPKMKEALAIVTDEGGITCHAAIVSRELGKPCIIGTRLSTKIFKTGDNIEVDLKKGIVRKVK